MTFDQLMELKRLTLNIRDKGRRSPEVLEAVDKLEAAITRISNDEARRSAENSRLLNAMDANIRSMKDLPMCRMQAD